MRPDLGAPDDGPPQGAPRLSTYPNDAEPSVEFPIYSRGNVGEAFPNVISPMSGSLMLDPSTRSQTRFFLATGALSRAQVEDPRNAMFVQFGGYLYANVSMARIAAVRAPGMTIDDLDAQFSGVGVLPPYQPRPGDRSAAASVRLARFAGRGLRKADGERARLAQREVAEWTSSLVPAEQADDAELLGRTRRASWWFDRMLSEMMTVTLHAGTTRILIERLSAAAGEPGRANVVTSGLGDVASAGPAVALWELGRRARSDAAVGAHFDRGDAGLEDRLRASVEARDFVRVFDAFLDDFGFHGVDELELSSPKWGTDPYLPLRMIERLRHAPDDRDPRATTQRLAEARVDTTEGIARKLRQPRARLFRLAVANAALYAREREATKSALVRGLYESRRALNELAARHGFDRADIYLLVEDELESALAHPDRFGPIIAARREQRAALQRQEPPFWFERVVPDPATWPARSAASSSAPDGVAVRHLEGLGVSAGIARGRARVILDPNETSELEPDEILIAPQTDPAWTPLFLSAAGVVVEFGAVMSHAAIVARELGIPAVVGVDRATLAIPTGAVVAIDGTTGAVDIDD